jgi:hypothetical protein
MDRIVKSRIQTSITRHQAFTQTILPSNNITFPVSNKDYLKFLVITSQRKGAAAAFTAADTFSTKTAITGVARPKLPITRIQI